jgi:hypothetical protein
MYLKFELNVAVQNGARPFKEYGGSKNKVTQRKKKKHDLNCPTDIDHIEQRHQQ